MGTPGCWQLAAAPSDCLAGLGGWGIGLEARSVWLFPLLC